MYILCISSPLKIGTWFASTFWLLWIMLFWTLVYKYFFESLLSFPGSIYLEAELLNHTEILSFSGTINFFPIAVVPFYIPTRNRSSPHPNTCYFLVWFGFIILLQRLGVIFFLIILLSVCCGCGSCRFMFFITFRKFSAITSSEELKCSLLLEANLMLIRSLILIFFFPTSF